MRVVPVNTQALLEAETLISREFMRVTARDRVTGDPVTEGFWSDLGECTAWVLDAETGAPTQYPFTGVGTLISTDPIPAVSNLTVQTIDVTFSQLGDRINELLRTYDLKQARIELYRGEFDAATMAMVEPASARFVGFVDGAPVETPAEGQEGSITLKCVSTAQELTRGNPDVRSHESQIARAPGDAFYKDTATIGDLTIFWGRGGSMRESANAE